MNVKIMSYNTQHCLNFVTREIDFDIIADTIRKCGADIIGLQEMRGAGDREDYTAQTEILAQKLGLYHYFAEAIRVGGTNPYGNAVLSRYPIISAEVVPIPDPAVKNPERKYESRCILKAKIDVGGGINVLVSHFGLNPDEQENAVKTVVENLPEEKCVLMGDFNMSPENETLSPIQRLLCDSADKFDSPKLSYPSDNPTVKIDYIFTSSDLTVLDADIPGIVSSDHRPHVATLDIK